MTRNVSDTASSVVSKELQLSNGITSRQILHGLGLDEKVEPDGRHPHLDQT
jgi:hypothetical protein